MPTIVPYTYEKKEEKIIHFTSLLKDMKVLVATEKPFAKKAVDGIKKSLVDPETGLAAKAELGFQALIKKVHDKYELYATGTTGTLIMGETGLKITRMKSGPKGGDQQIGSMIANSELDLVIFLRDPLTPRSHEPDVNSIVKLCDEHNIPLATNLATAELLIKSLDRGDLEWREMYK